jgi:hypothetical protein
MNIRIQKQTILHASFSIYYSTAIFINRTFLRQLNKVIDFSHGKGPLWLSRFFLYKLVGVFFSVTLALKAT